MKLYYFLFLLSTLLSGLASAASKADQKPEDGVSIEFEETKEDQEIYRRSESIDKIFKNSVLASGLASGADAINKSIESLMESIFYSLLDNELRYSFGDYVKYRFSFLRDVYDSQQGAYVIVDQFGLGPEFAKEIAKIQLVPITFGAQTGASVFDIYLRSDPMRIQDREDVPFWRYAVNNWFGILPILEAILPPSFNPNEMYDPLHRLEVPFVFPGDLEAVRKMPVGNIRSYSISGGVQLGIDWANFGSEVIDNIAQKLAGLGATLPYSVFIQGEHRINVLKRSEKTVWVGVNTARTVGHSINGIFGKTFFLLQNTIPYWKGFPVNVFPFDLGFEQTFSKLFGQIYEFDLSREEAQEAYLKAVHGDFTLAHEKYLLQREKNQATGVSFLFTKKEDRFSFRKQISQNLAVLRNENVKADISSNIEIQDPTGTFYILEAGQDWQRTWSDALTGKQEQRGQNLGDIKVVKVMRDDKSGKEEFRLAQDENPYFATLTYSINDKYIEAEEFADHVGKLRQFLMMPLAEVPEIELRDEDAIIERRRKATYDLDSETPTRIHVTPTYLGKMQVDASIIFSAKHIDQIVKRSRQEKWRAFAEAFGGDPEVWAREGFDRSFGARMRVAGSYLTYPLRFVNFNFVALDRVEEAARSIQALDEFEENTNPERKRKAISSLFATNYPIQMAQALLRLTDEVTVPRSVLFSVDPKGQHAPAARAKFEKVRNLKIRSEAKEIPVERYESIRAKEAEFVPRNLREYRQRPLIYKMSLRNLPTEFVMDSDPNSEQGGEFRTDNLQLTVSAKGIEPYKPAKVFVRIEQDGKLQLGKLKITEDIVDVTPRFPKSGPIDRVNLEVLLTGPLSRFDSFLLEQALNFGGDFKVSVSVMQDSSVWSEERQFRFRFDRGHLLPIR